MTNPGTTKSNALIRRARAVGMFLAAYGTVTVLCTLLSVAIGLLNHYPDTKNPLQNQAYVISERFDPIVNLLTWTSFAALYFRRIPAAARTRRHAVRLGGFWLGLALPIDFVFFVAIRNPLSLSPHDFYVGQFPWIYLIYATVFLGPLAAQRLLAPRSAARPAATTATAP